ncbi:hypothetical protein [Leptolyngbya sp. BL0902]|uniref:hypothetical protein n=1 Tax=Leptolyngbya sp. BL0902 TaxID=1115757 RepID=UPI0018E7FBFC|nr:hypothetical protein [Leptolyngbya sp. BL0902]
MMKPFFLKSWRWSGGSLLVLVSAGLHGLLLAMPTPKTSPPPESVTTLAPLRDRASLEASISDPVAVVRLPHLATSSPPPEAASPAMSRPHPTATSPASSAQELPLPPPAPTPERPALESPTPGQPVPEQPVPEQPIPEPTPSEPEPRPPGLVYNHKTVELTTDTRDFLTWYTAQNWDAFDPDPPLPAPKELSPLQVVYSGEICLPIPPAPGRLEVIVGSNGQLSRAPRLLATTGYDDLDADALALAAQQNFSEAANPSRPNPTVYWLPIEVQYQGPACLPG